jgi:DNA repair exonuclease SbcCD ATPase subunit
MTRERTATQELEGVLDLLNEVQQDSVSANADEAPPPRPKAQRQDTPLPSKHVDPVRVDGDDQLGRSTSEEKVAILRKKVRALEDRMQSIRDAWGAKESELDEARQEAQREKELREEAEASVKKLNAFIQAKKQEVEAYHNRVQEALREQMRREQEALQEAAKREREAREDADRRETEALQAAARREQKTMEEHARRERVTLQEHTRREQEAAREQARRERELKERLERAERAEREALEREKGTPPPPPLLTVSDVEELARSVSLAGRSIADLLKGRLADDEWQTAMREALRVLKSSRELLGSILKDMR